ncbi:MAG: M56 family peptidase [Gemmatimonadales bacterium]|nr:MAG: M56 family peptidase [Gemmatimonadales bacterium]
MLTGWMLYCVGISALVALAARAWEEARSEGGRTLRWGWFGGILAVPLVALLPPLLPERSLARAGGVGEATGAAPGAELLPGLSVEAGPVLPPEFIGLLEAATPWVVLLWVLATSGLLLRLLARYVSLRRAMNRWPRRVVAGREVLVSEEVGPGVLGLVRGSAILPQWCLGLEPEDQALVVTHEEEHLDRMDNLLLTVSRVLLIVLPWNLPLWWMDRRLRIAVELDCDARVTTRYPAHRRRYAELLLATAARPARAGSLPLREPVPHMLLAESSAPLHRRILMLTRSTPTPSLRRALLPGSMAGLLLLAAALVPGPDLRAMGGPSDLDADRATGLDAAGPVQADTPVFTPFTVAPEVRNRTEVTRALEREYPPLLRDAGVGGTVLVFFFINDRGEVEHLRIHESSGHEALDAAALRVGAVFEFSPAMNRDERVPVWIQIPLTFTTRSGGDPPATPSPGITAEATRGPPRAEARAATEAQARRAGDGPRFTPFTEAPEVRNRAAVGRALEREYPPLLRNAGIGGTVLVYFFVDAEGRVADVRLEESSGHEALDSAGLRVAEVFEFAPARNRGEPVPVWIQIPITFTTR